MAEPNTREFDFQSRLRSLAAHWHSLAGGDALPARSAIDPTAMRPWLGNILLVDVIDGGAGFTYRLYGSEVAEHFGRDLTGRTPSEFPAHHVDIILGAYRGVVETGRPRYTVHILSIDGRKFAAWERVVLPLSDDGRTVNHLLVGLYRVRIPDIARYRASLAKAGIEPAITQEAEGSFL